MTEHSSGIAPLVAGEHLLVASADSLPFVAESLVRDPERLATLRTAAYERLSSVDPVRAPGGGAACGDRRAGRGAGPAGRLARLAARPAMAAGRARRPSPARMRRRHPLPPTARTRASRPSGGYPGDRGQSRRASRCWRPMATVRLMRDTRSTRWPEVRCATSRWSSWPPGRRTSRRRPGVDAGASAGSRRGWCRSVPTRPWGAPATPAWRSRAAALLPAARRWARSSTPAASACSPRPWHDDADAAFAYPIQEVTGDA